MIRTRDFFLYVLCLVFLGLAIAVTVTTNPDGLVAETTERFVPSFSRSEIDRSAASPTELDRAANLEKLKQKLSSGAGEISAGEPVFTSVDTPEPPPPPSTTTLSTGTRTIQYCPQQLETSELENLWRLANPREQVVGTERQYMITKEVAVQNGSSTEFQLVAQSLLQLPTQPVRPLASSCIDADVIGVTTSGDLLKNSEVWRLRSGSSFETLAYARDGLPIRGLGTDETLLDSCGGFDDGTGYAYYVRSEEPFILGCFAAVPQPFTE